MKIYFAGSISAGRDDAEVYEEIIHFLNTQGSVLTEHVGSSQLSDDGEDESPEYIYSRDTGWIDQADIVVAEVSIPSAGVGYELGYAEAQRTPVIVLYRSNADRRLTPMISGNAYNTVVQYKELDDLKESLAQALKDYVQKT